MIGLVLAMFFHLCPTQRQRRYWPCCNWDPQLNKEPHAWTIAFWDKGAIAGSIYLTGSHWKLGVDLGCMCVFCLCLVFVCMCVCLCMCVYLWVTHCGQTPAHRLLVWLMNQYLQGVFEEVYCMPLFYTLKHPVLRLPLHTKEKINPLLTLPQWMAWTTVPSAISSQLRTVEDKDNRCWIKTKNRRKNKGVYRTWQ